MKNKKFNLTLLIAVLVCFFFFNGVSDVVYGVESESSYKSLHTGGFQNLHDPTTEEISQVTLRTKYPSGSLFRMYIPGGTERVTLSILLSANAKVGAAVRLGFPPQWTYDMTGNYSDYPWKDDNGAKLSEIGSSGQDYQAMNYGGHITLVNDSKPSATGKWLYVKLLKFESATISTVKFTAYVDMDVYLAWYEGFSNWDSNGDPLPLVSGNPTGTGTVFKAGEGSGGEGSGDEGSGDEGSGDDSWDLFGDIDPPPPPPGTRDTGDTGDTGDTEDTEDTEDTSSGEFSVGEGKVSVVPLNGSSSVDLDGIEIVFDYPPYGQFECYAAYMKDGDLYIAEEELDGSIAFRVWREEDAIKSYARRSFSGETTSWECTAFDEFGAVSTELLKKRDVIFYWGIAPEGEFEEDNFQYCTLYFLND